MTTSAKPVTFLPLAKLPRVPASDVKRFGWRGMMDTLRREGRLLITNHNEPQAVIVSVAEYEALMQVVERSEGKAESVLVELRRDFDERLLILQGRSAAGRLQSSIRGPATLGRKVKVGFGN